MINVLYFILFFEIIEKFGNAEIPEISIGNSYLSDNLLPRSLMLRQMLEIFFQVSSFFIISKVLIAAVGPILSVQNVLLINVD